MITWNRKTLRIICLLAVLISLLAVSVSPVGASAIQQAGDECETVFNPVHPPGTWTTICSGGGGGGTIINPPGGGGGSCTPGTIAVGTQVVGGDALCEVYMIWYDTCTGQIISSQLIDVILGGSCSAPPADPPTNPCIAFVITAGGMYCQTAWGIDWFLEASVSFPTTFLDIRPFPVTLVRWPSAVRNGVTPDAYWNTQVTVRRMDDNNQIDNPAWQASWSWGGVVYWAVREGQGQVGWP